MKLDSIENKPVEDSYGRTSPEAIAEKFALDIDYWHDFEIKTRNVTHFDGLRTLSISRKLLLRGKSLTDYSNLDSTPGDSK